MITDEKTYEVTGDLTPDATGTYEDAGEHNGKRYYVRGDSAYYIWWHLAGSWIISTDLDVLAPGHWFRMDPSIEGLYEPDGTYLGDPTVTEA